MLRQFIQSAVEFDEIEEFVDRVRAYDPFRSREHIERTVRYNMLPRADGKYVSKCDRNFAAPEADRGTRMSLDSVREFRLPVLVVRGAESNILEPEAAQRFVEALPDGTLVTVPACGHNVHSQNTHGFLAGHRALSGTSRRAIEPRPLLIHLRAEAGPCLRTGASRRQRVKDQALTPHRMKRRIRDRERVPAMPKEVAPVLVEGQPSDSGPPVFLRPEASAHKWSFDELTRVS